MSQTNFEARFNGNVAENAKEYRYPFRFVRKFPGSPKLYSVTYNIRIMMDEKSCKIIIENNTKICEWFKPYQDACRKMHLIYMLTYNKSFDVANSEYFVNEKRIFDNKYDYSSIFHGTGKLSLPKVWDDESIKNIILHTTKSGVLDNSMFISMYNYLFSKTKKNEIDKFYSLWIAVNGYYNALRDIYLKYKNNKRVTDEERKEQAKIISTMSKAELNEKNRKERLKAEKELTDSDLIFMMAATICNSERFGVKSNREELFEVIMHKQYEKLTGDVNKLYKSHGRSAWKQLYEYTYNEMNGEIIDVDDDIMDFINYNKENVIKIMSDNKESENTDFPIFIIFLLEYSYYWRNEIIHGKRTPPVLYGSDDREMAMFTMVNYFLSKFLNSNIPYLFKLHYEFVVKGNNEPDDKKGIIKNCLWAYEKMIGHCCKKIKSKGGYK